MNQACEQQSEQPQFLTVKECAALLRVKVRTIYEWTANNKIPYRKAGRYTIFDRNEIIEWTKSEAKNTVTVSVFSR
jgi:excisionase family DNA binding protein